MPLVLLTFLQISWWRRQQHPTPVFLPGESQRPGSLVGCHLWGRTEPDRTETTQQQQQISWIGTFHLKSNGIYIFLRCTWNIFQDRAYIRPQKGFNKFKRTEITTSIFFNYSGIKVEIHYVNKTRKITNMWQLNNMLLKNQQVKGKIKKNKK